MYVYLFFVQLLYISHNLFFNLSIHIIDDDKDDISSRCEDMKSTEMHFLLYIALFVMQDAPVTEPNFTHVVKPIY